ncbi:hypothetical protein DEU56DRAFT_784010 [Suillus clintonianus]|uniref:uncharacterized protein n=1 Tax=Suillus clintonianus TaxID=1904413 RepID=UPI001B883E70|nr:uncharacterized protein DEU56DRAFT_784010 [Suillus clintonianus]KAG2148076.1 hypothetical protein DEU56DRAFT_784010 [Suillus clintonianus]
MSAPTELHADPQSIKKLEKELSMEAKSEEKILQSAFKHMHKQEKLEAKTSKSVEKAEKSVKKLEKLELETVKSLHAITRKHDVAVADLHNAQAGLHTEQQQLETLKQRLSTARRHVDQVAKDKNDHDRERYDRLHSSPPTEIGGPIAGTSGASTGASQDRT